MNAPQGPTLCIGVIALNEARRIQTCLKSAAFADQRLVIDGGSRDETAKLAVDCGAEVFEYPDWKGFAEQRNRLLKHCTCDYIFFLDADEEFTEVLAAEVRSAISKNEDKLWEVQWNQVAFGRPLSHMKSTGGVRRLFKTQTIERFEGVVHEHAVVKPHVDQSARLKHRLLHHSRETIHDSLLKLAQYSHLGAMKRAQKGKRGGVLRGMASGAASFWRLYVMGRGFMCGPEGFLFCFLVALECFFRYTALVYDKRLLSDAVQR